MKFDEILQEIGEFGPYQKRIFFLMSLPAIICGLQVMSPTFVYDIPAHRCAIPDYPGDTYKIQNEAHAQLVNYTIPPGNGDDESVYSGCEIYDTGHTTHNTSVMGSMYFGGTNTTRGTVECSRRVFDKTDMKNTIITEFDLVCGQEIMRSHSNSLAFVGSFVGSLTMGLVADIFGRKKAILLALVLYIIFSLVTYTAQSIYVIMGFRVLGGVATHALFAIPATTGMELVGPNKRSFTGVAIDFYWTTGLLLVLPVAFFARQWRHMQLVIALLALPLLSLWWLVPESPRWLLDKKRFSEVEVILRKICKSNKSKMPARFLDGDAQEDEGPQAKISSMFTSKALIVRFLIVFFNWLVVNVFYYGLSLNMTNLQGDPYLNYLCGVLVEVFGYMACIVVVPRFKRRQLYFTFLTTGGLALLAVIPVVLTSGDTLAVNVLAQIGKFCAASCYSLLYIRSAELFPTVLRNSGIGFCSIFESIGGMCAPYIADLGVMIPGPLGKTLSMVVFGSISLLAAGLSLFLPETLHRKLPETVQDAIDFDKQKEPKVEQNTYEMAPVI